MTKFEYTKCSHGIGFFFPKQFHSCFNLIDATSKPVKNMLMLIYMYWHGFSVHPNKKINIFLLNKEKCQILFLDSPNAYYPLH